MQMHFRKKLFMEYLWKVLSRGIDYFVHRVVVVAISRSRSWSDLASLTAASVVSSSSKAPRSYAELFNVFTARPSVSLSDISSRRGEKGDGKEAAATVSCDSTTLEAKKKRKTSTRTRTTTKKGGSQKEQKRGELRPRLRGARRPR